LETRSSAVTDEIGDYPWCTRGDPWPARHLYKD
jgi:hypothetical protein